MPPDQRDRLLQLARDAGLSPARVSALEGQFRPSVRLFTTRIEGDVPVGTCRMGGAPDLPVGASWPRHGESDLDFLVQLDLAEVAAVTPDTPLPREGLLSFFAVLDARLAESPYLAGETFSVADIDALVTVDFARAVKRRIPDDAAALKRWYETVSARPSAAN